MTKLIPFLFLILSANAIEKKLMKKYLWQKRVIVVQGNEKVFKSERKKFLKYNDDVIDRQIVFVHQKSDRTIYLLYGKDGGVKLESSKPFVVREIFDLIDSMPMRIQEMNRKSKE